MKENREERIAHLVRWGEAQPQVRAMILTSTLAIPNGHSDIFSDYDVLLVLSDVRPFHAERGWLEAFGRVLALYRDPLEEEDGHLKTGYVIQFEGGLKIDFILWDVEIMQKTAAAPQLSDEFDAGYRVLLDKDHLTDGLKPPSYRGYIPKPPTEEQFLENIEVFFVDATYVAKLLWRDDIAAVKYLLDTAIKQEHLIPMLVWTVEIEHGWAVKPGPYGRGLKKWLRPDLWDDFAATYTGAGVEENWDALFKSVDLMRKAALEVGAHFGYAYPHEMGRKVVEHLRRVQSLSPDAESVY